MIGIVTNYENLSKPYVGSKTNFRSLDVGNQNTSSNTNHSTTRNDNNAQRFTNKIIHVESFSGVMSVWKVDDNMSIEQEKTLTQEQQQAKEYGNILFV